MSGTAAFEALYRQHRSWVLARCRAGLSGSDAEDACAEVFAKTWRHLQAGHAIDHPAAWLATLARHQIIDQYRRNSHIAPMSLDASAFDIPDSGPGPAELAASADITPIVRQWLNELSPSARAALIGRLTDQSSDATSRRIGCSPAALNASLHRARRRLRGQLTADASTHQA